MPFRRICFIATILAFVVVVLGAYTRLSDAGLGCPDWPGCYGQAFPIRLGTGDPPQAEQNPFPAFNQPQRGAEGEAPAALPMEGATRAPVIDTKKAWTEMIHRYFAGTLGLLILVIAIFSIVRRNQPGQPRILPLVLLGTVVFQALLGMWTVTLLLHPLVVMAHLLGGMTTLGLCWWLTFCSRVHNSPQPPLTLRGGDQTPPLRIRGGREGLRRSALFALLILILQIALGGWVSANYAALACPDFPTCMGQWFPKMEGPIAIQILHRIGALVTFLFLGFLAIRCLRRGSSKRIKVASIVMIFLFILQVSLGISIILFIRPLYLATAHTAIAALLLLTVTTLNHQFTKG